eukprot:s556_g25.t1
MAADPVLTVVFADSTAYGWLPPANAEGAATVMQGNRCSSIVCGGSLIKPGWTSVNIVDQFMQDWMLADGLEHVASGAEVEIVVVPARDAVPGRHYRMLEAARQGYGIRERGPTILATAKAFYGAESRSLHFDAATAADAMEAVVAAAVAAAAAGRAERRSARPANERAAERRSAGDAWVAVVVCAGWNCNEQENLAEAFLLREMQDAVDWAELAQVLSAHSEHRFPWLQTAPRLPIVPAVLLQTDQEDYPASSANTRTFAPQLRRLFVADEEVHQDLHQVGGVPLAALCASFHQGSHRADLWRYTRLHYAGGNYLDMKMAAALGGHLAGRL